MKKGRTVIIHIFINIYVYTCLREGAGPDKINFGLCTDVYENCKHVCWTLRDPYYCRKASQEVLFLQTNIFTLESILIHAFILL